MNLSFNIARAKGYTSQAQIVRRLTEDWVLENSYCPNCGTDHLSEFENNKPVADFFCASCAQQFELKSKNGEAVGNKIVDGTYSTMIERINSDSNPHFFFLTYNKLNWSVHNFLIIPKHYFTTDIIEQRKPLSPNAKRAGWVGCNISLSKVPSSGRVFLVQNAQPVDIQKVRRKWQSTAFLQGSHGDSKGWLLDIMNCIDAIKGDAFSLSDIYAFEDILKTKHPNNKHVKDKIRQQLQVLRDKGFIVFEGRGNYRKVEL